MRAVQKDRPQCISWPVHVTLDPMELTWTSDPQPVTETRESNVAGWTKWLGPFIFGHFRYVDDEGGGFTFILIRGTKLGLNWEW